MKILMIAPEPFFEPRGTPFSEYFRIQALGSLGHQVDLVTYPIGEDKKLKGLKIFRSMKIPFISSIKTGPSLGKIFLDFFLFFKALGRLIVKRYDLIHTHEEANIMGSVFSKITGIPHLYDMHSSLVQQMNNFQFTQSKFIVGFFKFIEKVSLNNARSVIVICPSLYDYAAGITSAEKLTVVENFMDETPKELNRARLESIQSEINGGEKKIILYAGTLETYQGIPLLIDSLKHLDEDFLLVMIGGDPHQITSMKDEAVQKGVGHKVKFLGRKEPGDIPYYIAASDILVSPRILGTNIPLKVYSYLKSGVPLVATNLYTHTQSIGKDIAFLVDPDEKAFAEGIRRAGSDEAKEVSQKALQFCQENYSHERYVKLVDQAVKKACKRSLS